MMVNVPTERVSRNNINSYANDPHHPLKAHRSGQDQTTFRKKS